MNEIHVFNSPDFGDVRTITIDNDVWFCLSDVCRVLDIKNPSDMKSRLNPRGVVITDTPTASGTQPMNYINEPNLYRTIFQSRKPEAEKFSDWVTNDVLPSIRKTGSYSAIDRSKLSDQMQMFYALADHGAMLEMEQKRLDAAQREQAERISALEIRQTAISDAVKPVNAETWRKDINKKIMRIQIASGIHHEELFTAIYTELDRRAGTNLKARLKNMRDRLCRSGASKTQISHTNNMDVIICDKKLREILEKILTEYELHYNT